MAFEKSKKDVDLVCDEYMFNQWYKTFRSEIKKILRNLNCDEIKITKGYFYSSGFFRSPSGQIYYFSIPDIRYNSFDMILVRTAESFDDFTGGSNNFLSVDNFDKELYKLINRG